MSYLYSENSQGLKKAGKHKVLNVTDDDIYRSSEGCSKFSCDQNICPERVQNSKCDSVYTLSPEKNKLSKHINGKLYPLKSYHC